MKAQPEKRLPPQQKPSALEQHKFTYQEEALHEIAQELLPLFIKHHKAIIPDDAAEPLDINWEAYFRMEIARILHVFTVRYNGTLCGYVFNIIVPNLHSRGLINAMPSMYFLLSKYRKSRAGINLVKNNEAYLKTLNVKTIRFQARNNTDKLFKRLGYEYEESIYLKRL